MRSTKNIKNHILFLVSSMHAGGAERVAALLCNHWVAQGHQVTLIPTFSGRGECFYPLDDRVRLNYLADRVGATRQSTWNKIRRLWVLRKIIREEKPDVVVSFMLQVNIAAIMAGVMTGVPVIVSERTYPPMQPVTVGLKYLRHWCYSRASAVVMQTTQGKKWLESAIPRAQGRVIPNPVVYPLPGGEPRVMPDEVVPAGQKVLLAVGRLGEEKRFSQVIDAFSELADKYLQWDLVILGEGKEREALELKRGKYNLDARVHLPGRVGNLSDWYQRASLYVMSSLFEGFPNVLLEAMAYGLPVVSVDCDTGPRDIIQHDVDGWLVPSADNVAGLTRAIEALMADSAQRARMAAEAIKVRERFSMESVAASWGRVLGLK